MLHDVGIAVHRQDHEQHSLFVASPKAKELLAGLYDMEQSTIIWAETMHAIIAHNRSVTCLTVEAGVAKVADALDMSKGRSRIPFEAGQVNIHSISAAAVDKVTLGQGRDEADQHRHRADQFRRHLPDRRAAQAQAQQLRPARLHRGGGHGARGGEKSLVQVFRL